MPFIEVPPEARDAYTESERETQGHRLACGCSTCENAFNRVVGQALERLQVATEATPTIDPEAETGPCEFCGEERELEDFGYRELCAPCLEDAGTCDWCNMSEPSRYLHEMRVGDRSNPPTLCEGCRDDLRWCDHCEQYYTEDTYFPDYDTCEGCYESRSDQMHSWNYRPTPIFCGSDENFHFGVEIEMESVSQTEVPETIGRMEAPVYTKSDGSLYDGVEVVTHPGTLTAWQEGQVIPWGPWNAAGEGVFGTQRYESRAGIHVHVSRTAFNRRGRWSAAHMWKFMQLHYRNEVAFQKLSGRDGSSYASWNQAEDRQATTPKAKAGLGYAHDRYSVINVNNEATVECRYFQSDERQEIILKDVELVHAAVEYTRNLPAKAVKDGLLDYKYFRAWFVRRKERYPNLVRYAEQHPNLVKTNRDKQQQHEKRIRMEILRERRRQQRLAALYGAFNVPVPANPDNLMWDRMLGQSPEMMRSWWASRHGTAYMQYAINANSPDRLRTLTFMIRDTQRRYVTNSRVRQDNAPNQYEEDQLRTMRAWYSWDLLEAILETTGIELTDHETTLMMGEINAIANWN